MVNINAFSNPLVTSPGQFGNSVSPSAGRNLLSGPALLNWDFSLFKDFKIRESQTLQFRAEFFNLFNTPQFNNPAANVRVAGTFGRSSSTISSTGFPSQRQLQFALKYIF